MISKTNKNHYQNDFSGLYNKSMYDLESRHQKAKKAVAVIYEHLESYYDKKMQELFLLDIGCSTGYMTSIYGNYFGQVVGIDIDKSAIDFAQKYNSNDNVHFKIEDS